MMWYDYPKREEFDVCININVRLKKSVFKKKLILKYNQASISDTIEFLSDIGEGNASTWLLKFVEQHGDADKTTL
jgi:hypothetical protein